MRAHQEMIDKAELFVFISAVTLSHSKPTRVRKQVANAPKSACLEGREAAQELWECQSQLCFSWLLLR